MATIMKYDEYIAEIEFDSDYETFFGNVINLSTPVTFYGKTVKELKQEFIHSIKTYLTVCKERGIEPGKPYSGELILRINPDLHRKIAVSAQREGKSVNKWITKTLEENAA